MPEILDKTVQMEGPDIRHSAELLAISSIRSTTEQTRNAFVAAIHVPQNDYLISGTSEPRTVRSR